MTKENTLLLSTFSVADHQLSNFKPINLLWQCYMHHAERWAQQSTLRLREGRAPVSLQVAGAEAPSEAARGSRARNTQRSKTARWTMSCTEYRLPTGVWAVSLCKRPIPLRLLLQGPHHTFKKPGCGLFLSRMISKTLQVWIPESS